MLKSGLRVCQAVLPISKIEFLDAISRVCPDALQDGERKLGLAVSGGVDSMALAVMCHEYLPRNGTELRAIIVDHGLRPSSKREALQTKETLEGRIGIKSDVLTLDVSKILQKRSIETHARSLRYQAIIKHGKSRGIKDLLAAHHRDDQHETVLMRLSQAATNSLQIREVTRVPESLLVFPSRTNYDHWRCPSRQDLQCLGVKGVANLHMALRRPLLRFSKERLIATCKAFDIPWHEDETNKDKTLTTRNSIRHIVAHAKLPAALSECSLSQLAAERGARTEAAYQVADQLFSITNIELDIRTGSAVITAPGLEQVTSILPNIAARSSKLSAESLNRVVAGYFRRLTQLVVPTPGASAAAVQEQMTAIFGNRNEKKRFTLENTLFDPLCDGRWLLSSATARHHIRGGRLDILRFGYCPQFSDIRLFDHRWWFSVANPSPMEHLHVRYLRPAHLVRLNQRLKAGEIILKDVTDPFKTPRNLDAILRSLGPHYVRFWLPVIVSQSWAHKQAMDALDPEQRLLQRAFLADPDAETLLAFPTLNLRVHGKWKGSVPWWIEDLQWEVWYKHLDQMEGRLEDSIVLPTTKESRGLV